MFVWLLVSFSILFSAPAEAKGRAKRSRPHEAHADWQYVEKRLKKEGFKKSFIQTLKKNYETNHFAQTIELNLLLFLKKTDYHGVQINARAADDVQNFMAKNTEVLQKAQNDHGVHASVIASLMWMESRYGQNLGRFHVPSVYAHLLQVERPSVIKHLHRRAGVFTKKLYQKTFVEITKRTKRKADWALEELRALQAMQDRDKETLKNLRGSFAGAFGMPQFIPSSYVHWARPYKGKVAHLNEAHDAIYSVGFYLKDNGWKQQVADSHVKALLKYNNSYDYANAILKLAEQVDNLPRRRPSGQ